MKRLWKIIPPCMSDILGFQAALIHTDGLAVVDDSSNYKPFGFTRGGMQGGRPAPQAASRGERPTAGRDGAGGRMGTKRGGGSFGMRIVSSGIQEADVVSGTAEKLMEAFEQGYEEFKPQFALLTTAPCAAMINTDLNEVAQDIQARYSIPAGMVALDGQKDYLYGVSCTLEAMGKLLLEQAQTLPGTVNLLGCNCIDWSESMVQEAERWLTEAGFQVLSKWGAKESAGRLKQAAAASVNLVVNISGLRLARYMEQTFQIPYVVGAPFGAKQCERLLEQLKDGGAPIQMQELDQSPEALVIGEQLEAEAIRRALLERGWKAVRVCSFFEMDKQLMQPGDAKLVSEEELCEQLGNSGIQIVFGDSDYQAAAGRPLKWVPLANPANQAPSAPLDPFSLAGGALDRWLDETLAQASVQR